MNDPLPKPAVPRYLRPIPLLALALYGASLAAPAFVCGQGKSLLGYEVLMSGWLGLLALDPRWLANPLALWMFCSALFGSRSKYTVLGAVFTLVLAAGSLLPAVGCAGAPGSAALALGPGTGAWLWIVAVSALAICAMRDTARQEAATPLPPAAPRALDTAIHAALVDFRDGRPPRTRCPQCRALVLVTPERERTPGVATPATMACACGACDGRYEVGALPA